MPPIRQWFNYTSRERWQQSGMNSAWLLNHQSIAKERSNNSPYLVPNEWICARLGQFIGLPIPPFALVRAGASRKGMFASLRFGAGEVPPDDTDPAVLAASHSDVCTGIILFDAWVANLDRHPGNIKVDHPNSPAEIRIFDHDCALFGNKEGEGISRLETLRNALAIERYHCLMRELATSDHLGKWYERIRSTTKWFIEDTCEAVCQMGITRAETNAAIDFLIHRASRLQDIVRDNHASFPRINWGLFP